ncbi:hypothetical protein [Caenispirillum salinarum]|uniref:hypothetical protein n=1 Tax=Caenispirillum salinarum TaxID=859058 RepID=UPI00384A780F
MCALVMTAAGAPVEAADDPATARRAPPIFDVMKEPGTARSRAAIPTITPPDIPLPEHVRPPQPAPPGAKPWPPTQRERMGFREETDPLVPKRKPCIPGMPDCR